MIMDVHGKFSPSFYYAANFGSCFFKVIHVINSIYGNYCIEEVVRKGNVFCLGCNKVYFWVKAMGGIQVIRMKH